MLKYKVSHITISNKNSVKKSWLYNRQLDKHLMSGFTISVTPIRNLQLNFLSLWLFHSLSPRRHLNSSFTAPPLLKTMLNKHPKICMYVDFNSAICHCHVHQINQTIQLTRYTLYRTEFCI